MLNDKIKKELLNLYNVSESELSKIYKKSETTLKEFTKKNPEQVKKTLLGGGLAGGLATLKFGLGSIGVLGYGIGIGIPVALLALVGGAVVGNRMGIGKDLENLIKKEEAKADKRHNSKSNNFRFSGKESHNKELINAFKSATDTLCIRSAFISKFVVNEKFEHLLIETLSRSVNVYIETGYKFTKTPQPEKIQTKEAIDRLRKIEEKFRHKKGYGKLYVGRTPIHMKEISVDSKYFLSGSNNWLSNKSFQNKESSLRIIDQTITKEIRDEAIISVRSNQIIPKII